jgi:hypothetical protein
MIGTSNVGKILTNNKDSLNNIQYGYDYAWKTVMVSTSNILYITSTQQLV